MTATVEIKELHCEHCGRNFVRAGSFQRHMCEARRRFQDQGRPSNRIAYAAWLEFYRQCQPSRRKLAYSDFSASTYYSAFVRWGNYCCEIGAVAPDQFARWLITNNRPLDQWASDRSYTEFLLVYLRHENCLDAVRRGLDYLLDLCDSERLALRDVFRYVNSNRLCLAVCRGQLSAWLLYQSEVGRAWLAQLNQDQQNLVFDYVNPEAWALVFHRNPQAVSEVRGLLDQAFQ